MVTLLKIAGIGMKITTPQSYPLIDNFRPFHVDQDNKVDLNIEFIPVDTAWIDDETISDVDFYLEHRLEKDGVEYIGFHFDHCACHAWMTTDGKVMKVFYLNDFEKFFSTEKQIFGPICLEYVLNLNHGFILHSSFIRWNESGILFTAPSGTGKSTQAELWEKYENAEILNGDRSALRNVNGIWRAYGFPFAGSSGIYRNESCPIAAIILLEQGLENEIKRAKINEAFRFIYSQLTLHPWDNAFMDRAISDLTKLIEQVPIYRFSCRPDQDAVLTLKEEIKRNIYGNTL